MDNYQAGEISSIVDIVYLNSIKGREDSTPSVKLPLSNSITVL